MAEQPKFTQDFFIDKLKTKFEDMARLLGGKEIVMKELAFAAQILSNNDKLKSCDLGSILSAVYNIAGVGLSLNPALNYAYLVPMKGRCVLQVGYQGFVKLITDGGAIKAVEARVVYENDSFDYMLGDKSWIAHKPTLKEKGQPIAAYSIAYLPDGQKLYEVMPIADIYEVRNTSISYSYWVSTGKKGSCIWFDWEGEMTRKTIIKRHFKYLPKSGKNDNRIAAAFELEAEEYKVSEGQIQYIESLIQTSGYDTDTRQLLLEKASSGISVIEFNNMVADLKENQLDPVTQRGNPNQTQIGEHIDRISGDNRKSNQLL